VPDSETGKNRRDSEDSPQREFSQRKRLQRASLSLSEHEDLAPLFASLLPVLPKEQEESGALFASFSPQEQEERGALFASFCQRTREKRNHSAQS